MKPQQRKVLIVDDSIILGKTLVMFLNKNGYQSQTVSSGEACLHRVENDDIPDLILMDIYLGPGGMNGLETTRKLHASYDIPVVLHSAYNDRETLRSTQFMTKYGYIYKTPGNEEFVLAHIEMAFKLIERERMFRDLSAHLHHIKEEQNAFLAREIHDDLGQSIAALKMNLTMLERAANRAEMQPVISDMRSILDSTITKTRALIHELRPPVLDTNGIIEALRWHLEDYRKQFGIDVVFAPGIEELELGAERSLAVFRIVQEALTNVARHSGATRVRVDVRSNSRTFLVVITDNGTGFARQPTENASRGFGILSMTERAERLGGRFRIHSEQGQGTRVSVVIPHPRHCPSSEVQNPQLELLSEVAERHQ